MLAAIKVLSKAAELTGRYHVAQDLCRERILQIIWKILAGGYDQSYKRVQSLFERVPIKEENKILSDLKAEPDK
ncbi:hypothetical protein DRP07_01825 [Archaeoglobales archaeon]|nr:MAG: hypothetical protein DRP07_01825 [Archaeoglobales archaeon]